MRFAIAGCLILLAFGCDPIEPTKPVEPDPASNLPPARVDLPELVKLEGTIPPETHPDHTLRVDGLLARRDKYLEKKVIVRGYLIEKYECVAEAEVCEHPHAWLADTPAGGDKRLMIVRLDERTTYALEVGQQYVVTGNFTRSEGGFLRSTGLLVTEAVDGLELPDDKAWKKIRRAFKKRRRKAQAARKKKNKHK